jgi:hypothetical protein
MAEERNPHVAFDQFWSLEERHLEFSSSFFEQIHGLLIETDLHARIERMTE